MIHPVVMNLSMANPPMLRHARSASALGLPYFKVSNITEPWNSLWRHSTRTFQDLRWENTGTLGSLRPPPILRLPVPRDPVAKLKIKAYMRVGGANQGFRTPADAARRPLLPPLPQVIGGSTGVRVASVPILPARGGNAPARVAVVKTPPPPPPPPVGATPSHAVQGGQVPSHAPPVGAKPPHPGQGGHVPFHASASGFQGA